MPTLAIDETQLRAGLRIDQYVCRLKIALDAGDFTPESSASLEGEVVSDTKDPALKV
jgi:hypothetical protein